MGTTANAKNVDYAMKYKKRIRRAI
jgi:hypothetical protein